MKNFLFAAEDRRLEIEQQATYQKALLRKKAELLLSLEISHRRTLEMNDGEAGSEKKGIWVRSNRVFQGQLQKVEDALGRLKGGGYGKCLTCGAVIAEEELRAVPWVRDCIACRSAERWEVPKTDLAVRDGGWARLFSERVEPSRSSATSSATKPNKPVAVGMGIAIIVLVATLVAWQESSVAAKDQNPHSQPTPHEPGSVPRQETATVPRGARINIRLEQDISGEKSLSGVIFRAVLMGPIWVDGKYLAPSRSKFIGRFIDVSGPGRGHGRTSVAAVLQTLIVNGKEYDLETEPLVLPVLSPNRKDAAGVAASTVPGSGMEASRNSRSSTGFVSSIKNSRVIYETGATYTFTLSGPTELPVIRELSISHSDES